MNTPTPTPTSASRSASALTSASTSTRTSVGTPPATSRTVDEIDDAIGRLVSRINAASFRLLVLVREFDDRLGWAKWSFPSCADWLAWRCGLSLSAARERLRTAHALRGLPEISTAFAAGRLSYSKVRALTRVAGELCGEKVLLAHALRATAAQVEERCRQIRNVAPESAAGAYRAWERRSLSISRNPARGTLTITVEVPVEDGEVIARAIDRAVDGGDVGRSPELEAGGWQAQQADALVVMAKAYLRGDSSRSRRGDLTESADCASGSAASSEPNEPASASAPNESASGAAPNESASVSASADHYQVVVHVDETALRGGAGRADLPVETIRRLTCDGSLVAVVEDDRGAPLDVGRKQRTVSTALRRALWSRDRGCRFPGCHHTRFVDAHHIRHWADGGEATLENTMLLCTYHHRLLHEGSFRIRRDHEGALYFQRTDGRVIPSGGYRAEDVLDEGLDEWRLAAVVRSRKPSAEVRERAAMYAAA